MEGSARPQRLKPKRVGGDSGTAEAVPFPFLLTVGQEVPEFDFPWRWPSGGQKENNRYTNEGEQCPPLTLRLLEK